ncbi:GRIP [Lepeophtheirus salmonis]|uniref:GRIP n=1 Tax=Lepeophtheirus salmonis TaxID=72036 RepID=A0A7R8D3K1_LEPSM|nr:GRIP [Lepeophtheirus salmonis]CAF3017532.1 GRIP [Lepeophtheirus salmonis]
MMLIFLLQYSSQDSLKMDWLNEQKTIQINDQVMEINGTPIHDKSLNEVIPLLQSSHEVIKLKLARLIAIPERDSSINGNTILRSNSVKLSRKPPLPSPSPSPRSLSGINTVSLLTPLLSRSSPSPVPLRPIPMEVHKIILFKDKVYEDFGFSVSDGLYDKGIYINRIRKGGPAHSCELLQPFDRILQINDTRTHEFDCCLAVPLIAAAGDKIELLVTRSGGPLPEIKDYPYSNGSTKNSF